MDLKGLGERTYIKKLDQMTPPRGKEGDVGKERGTLRTLNLSTHHGKN